MIKLLKHIVDQLLGFRFQFLPIHGPGRLEKGFIDFHGTAIFHEGSGGIGNKTDLITEIPDINRRFDVVFLEAQNVARVGVLNIFVLPSPGESSN